MKPIRPAAVIFDYGNVLCQPQPIPELEAMAAIFETPLPSFLEIYWRYRVAYDQADLDPNAYWAAVASDLRRSLSHEQIGRLIEIDVSSWAHPNPVMLAWARELRSAGLRTAILSNMPTPLRDYLESGCPWLPAFDNVTFSCDVRSTKPTPGIYLHCLRGLNVSSQEALFFDDREDNVRAAEALGIHAVHFTGTEPVRVEIEDRFSLPVPLRG